MSKPTSTASFGLFSSGFSFVLFKSRMLMYGRMLGLSTFGLSKTLAGSTPLRESPLRRSQTEDF